MRCYFLQVFEYFIFFFEKGVSDVSHYMYPTEDNDLQLQLKDSVFRFIHLYTLYQLAYFQLT